MATKAALAAALLVALVALSTATSFTTTIITNSLDEDTNPGQQQCRQMVQGRQFRACQRYFQQRRGPFEMEEEELIEMSTGRQAQQQQYLEECCQQLKEMDRQQCGCEAIRHAVRQAQQQGGSSYQTGQSEQIYRKAQSLPRMCGLRQQQCRFRLVLV